MIIKFIKISHKEYRLKCLLDNKIVFDKLLESKSFLRHDLMHYVIESKAELKYSFFGNIKSGDVKENTEIMETERLVAVLQNINKDVNYSAQKYFHNITQMYTMQNIIVPKYLSESFIKEVGDEYFNLLRIWDNLTTGENCYIQKEF